MLDRPPLPRPASRVDALDALRGLAILAMALSGYVPFGGALPAWMHHAQVPPPEHTHDPGVPGITWVDLVFPFFLFSLGAAIPLAQRRRLATGATITNAIGYALRRGLLLLLFAIYVFRAQPSQLTHLATPEEQWTHGLLGFGILLLIFTRLPRWPGWLTLGVRAVGVAAAAWFVRQTFRGPPDKDFAFENWHAETDIIIIVLANTVVLGSIIWLLSRRSPAPRIALLLLLLGWRLTHDQIPWADYLWDLGFLDKDSDWRPVVLRFINPGGYWQYLHVVIPGTLVGDLIARRRQPTTLDAERPASSIYPATLALCGLALNIVAVCCLFARQLNAYAAACAALCALALFVASRDRTPVGRQRWRLTLWATLLVAVGVLFEPYEGGVKKDPPTVSYYYTCAGLATFLLLTLDVVATARRGWVAPLIDNGRNPLLAYVAIRNLVPPLVGLALTVPVLHDYGGWIYGGLSKALGFAGADTTLAVGKTLLLGALVMALTRLRILWRT